MQVIRSFNLVVMEIIDLQMVLFRFYIVAHCNVMYQESFVVEWTREPR